MNIFGFEYGLHVTIPLLRSSAMARLWRRLRKNVSHSISMIQHSRRGRLSSV
jgi:hypothetical protein